LKVVGEDRRPLSPARRAEILKNNEALAGEALRTLGVAGRWLTRETLAEHSTHPDERLERSLCSLALSASSILRGPRRRLP
jgi:Ca2+-transporting ATPase